MRTPLQSIKYINQKLMPTKSFPQNLIIILESNSRSPLYYKFFQVLIDNIKNVHIKE